MDRAGLEALSTDELRAKAFAVAERRVDVGFFWDLLKHLPAATELASDDSFAAPSAAISDLVELFRELGGHQVEAAEPLLRAKYVDYLVAHQA